MTPDQLNRSRGFLLTFMRRQRDLGWMDMGFLAGALRDRVKTVTNGQVEEMLDYLESHKCVLSHAQIDSVTGERQRLWKITTSGIDVLDGNAKRPAGVEW